MFDELKKKSVRSSLAFTIILGGIGLALAIYFALGTWYVTMGYVPFVKLAPDEIRNQWVAVDLTENWGSFAETTEKRDNRPETTINVYYVIATGDIYDTDYRYMAVNVPTSYVKQMDKMANGARGSIFLSGRIKKMDDKIYKYFKDYFLKSDWTEEEFQAATIPYYIKVYPSETSENIFTVIAFLAGVLFIILAVFRIIKAVTGGYTKLLREDIASIGVTETTAESDWNSAAEINKNVRVGRLFTFYMDGSKPRAIPNTKIIWGYQNTITHRTNGIKTGTTYSVILWIDGRKNGLTLNMPNEATAQEMLKRYGATLPWVVVGYSEELRKMYHSNRAQFLQLRYNTVEHTAAMPGFERDPQY